VRRSREVTDRYSSRLDLLSEPVYIVVIERAA
jgi:hypothetical protein